MTHIDYFKLALKEKLLHKFNWYVAVFCLYVEENEYCVMQDGDMYVKIGEESYKLDDYKKDTPILSFQEAIELSNEDMKNITGKIQTTIGRAIANYILLQEPFNGMIAYKNESMLEASKVEDEVMSLLKSDKIEVKQYSRFVDNVIFLSNLSKIILQPITSKNILPPPNIDKIKSDLIKEFNDKFGKDWSNDKLKAAQYLDRLTKIDYEYLKDDPSFGITLNGKALKSRIKKYLAMGASPSKLDPNPKFMVESLNDGFPLDKEVMSGVINSIIDASVSRGKDTQIGGTYFKVLTKMGRDLTIVPGDCGSKLYKEIVVSKDNAKTLNGVYMLDGSKVVSIQDANTLIGRSIQIRSPLFCKSEGKSFCEVCVGDILKDKKNALGLMFTYISEVFLTASLKKMHNTELKLTKFNVKDVLK